MVRIERPRAFKGVDSCLVFQVDRRRRCGSFLRADFKQKQFAGKSLIDPSYWRTSIRDGEKEGQQRRPADI